MMRDVKQLRELLRSEAPFERKTPLRKYIPQNTPSSHFLDTEQVNMAFPQKIPEFPAR